MVKVQKSETEWRNALSPEQYHVTREQGTERAFSGPHQDEKRQGDFNCICCGNTLFETKTKYDSGTGWPSFFEPKTDDCLSEHEDRGLFTRRTEVRCADCDAHLGHVFKDGPQPTGLRYCMNGQALQFAPNKDQS